MTVKKAKSSNRLKLRAVQQLVADEVDVAPLKPYQPGFPIVGIGASAGGLQATMRLLEALPVDTGMGFVLVQHLSPDRPSKLAEILARSTKMPVTEAHGEPLVQPNHVYIIPPGLDMCVTKGTLELVPRQSVRGQHRPIDQFFRSLAEDQAHCAIGVVLSGTANDGALGITDIKAEGGITFAQDTTAQQASMPRSAIATGCIDFVLSPQEIARELVRIAHHPYSAPEPESGGAGEADEKRLAQILQRLSTATGVDFTRYKASTLGRRVSRRLALHKIAGLAEYEEYLRSHPEELKALYEDALIHVTRFFRDPEVFETLRMDVLPQLFRGRTPQESLRLWVLGCSTGEEAYSLAIVCAEFAEAQGFHIPIQVFASDVSAKVIEKARLGVYPLSIAQDVSPERLRRYFTEVNGSYQVNRTIRDTCVFAPHNVLTTPPFSRMDLVSCRNLLIYLEAPLQQQILPLLHYALKPGGHLVLGKSETTGASQDLFEVADVRHRIYARKAGTTARLTGGRFPSPLHADHSEPGPAARGIREPVGSGEVQREADRLLAARYAPPGVLVNDELEILQFWGDTSPFLAPLPGKATLNILRMARPGLLVTLRLALQKARTQTAPVRHDGLHARSEGGSRPVSLEVVRVPVRATQPGGFLILFEGTVRHAPGAALDVTAPPPPSEGWNESAESENVRLTHELTATRDYLQSMIEQEQVVNEELQSANEEAQSANEEMQSVNEELETTKEEIQATNEELSTINDELQDRNHELQRINNDWINLLESVEVPIIILGWDLRIRQFSPAAGSVLNLMPADVGRSINAFNLSLTVELEPLVKEVMDSRAGQEREVERLGRWYSLRVRPYQTPEKKVDGAVLVFVDVDTLKRSQQFAEAIVSTVREPLLVLDQELRVRTVHRSFCETFLVPAEELEGRPFFELSHGQWDLPDLRRLLEAVLHEGIPFENFLVELDFEHLGPKTMQLNARRFTAERGAGAQILLAFEDVTARRALEIFLQRRVEEMAAGDIRKNEFLAMLAHELRNPLAPVVFANELLARGVAGEPALERQCELIERQMRQLSRLLDDLLEASRASQGKVTLQCVPLDLTVLVSNTVASAHLVFELRRQELTFVGPREPLCLYGDPTRLEQIITNLLHNASKYTERGGKIRITLEAEPGEAVVRVADAGMGIGPELLPRIFELFTQGERTLDRSQGGLGIGLALVRSLVTLHGGTVTAHSEGIGRGSEFVVRLPLPKEAIPAPEVLPHPNKATARDHHGHLPQPRVLVVDDNHDGADTLIELAGEWGYQLRAAYDGPTAIAAALDYHPQVILLDIGLPGMDGYQVARQLRQEPSLAGVQLVAFTGYGSVEDRQRSRDAGFDHHLTKPVDPQELEQLLASLFAPSN